MMKIQLGRRVGMSFFLAFGLALANPGFMNSAAAHCGNCEAGHESKTACKHHAKGEKCEGKCEHHAKAEKCDGECEHHAKGECKHDKSKKKRSAASNSAAEKAAKK